MDGRDRRLRPSWRPHSNCEESAKVLRKPWHTVVGFPTAAVACKLAEERTRLGYARAWRGRGFDNGGNARVTLFVWEQVLERAHKCSTTQHQHGASQGWAVFYYYRME